MTGKSKKILAFAGSAVAALSIAAFSAYSIWEQPPELAVQETDRFVFVHRFFIHSNPPSNSTAVWIISSTKDCSTSLYAKDLSHGGRFVKLSPY